MKIVNFTNQLISQANALTLANYNEERGSVPALPQISSIPNLTNWADNGLGVAAFDGNKMIGFICNSLPFDYAFGSTDARGVFSPMGSNAAIKENRAKIYATMYQAIGEKWVNAGAVSHAICLYAHDWETNQQFFNYGFGLRCIDAVREMNLIDCDVCEEYDYIELSPRHYKEIYPLYRNLFEHHLKSPFFMNRAFLTSENFEQTCQKENARYFVAKSNGNLCAYMKIENTGETFIAGGTDYHHIGGAYCIPKHRGKGVYQNLLNFTISALKSEGYNRLGVDFESFNPTAYGFWLKYFTAYTHGVVRRVDERILNVNKE